MSSAMIAASCVVFSPGSMDATPPIASTIKPLPNDQAAALVDEPLREASFGAACRHSRFIRLRKSGALVSAASAPHAVELRLDHVEGLVGVEDGLTVGVHTWPCDLKTRTTLRHSGTSVLNLILAPS